MERGLVIAMPDESEIDKRSQLGLPILLSADIFGILFQGLEYCVNFSVGLSAQGRIVRCDDIASRTLYYDAGTQEEVNRLLAALFADRFGAIMDRLSQRGRRRTMSCLLYGPPGTGKTELALQIARSTGRNIVQADIAKMTGTYVGESERNYRSLFTAYRYAAKVMVITPILLLNEADSFLSRRVHVSRSTDKYENNLQNILLEELESFEGILMATTNHTEGIDDAFDRRFFMKVEIGVPGRDTRLRIWQDVMPALSTDEVSLLADGFVLSGAQISNVATRYDFIVVLEDRNPSFSELVDLCRAEENRATGQRRNKIGFGKVIGSK
ncbi:MAG: ATP-binding protein [Bacteroidales bacterium]|nr:ATP-binding protein [Bacteroidales bacterium]